MSDSNNMVYVYTKVSDGTDFYAEVAETRVFATKGGAQACMQADYERELKKAKEDGNDYDDRQCEDIGEPYITDCSAFLPTGCASNHQRLSWDIVPCGVEP